MKGGNMPLYQKVVWLVVGVITLVIIFPFSPNLSWFGTLYSVWITVNVMFLAYFYGKRKARKEDRWKL